MLTPLPTRSIRALTRQDTPAWPKVRTLASGADGRLAYRLLGNPTGDPWLVLHGGPGSGCHPGLTRPFDLTRHWVIAPDQRGAGMSSPRGSTRSNTTKQLVADLDRLRCSLGIARWSILAGSWGTVLALSYAHAHPESINSLIMRGAFGLKRAEIEGVLIHRSCRQPWHRLPFHWPQACYANASSILARLEQVLQVGTHSVASRDVIRFWSQREQALALKGQLRASRQLAQGSDRSLANQARAVWASAHRQIRQTQAQRHHPHTLASDRQGWQKFRLQAHYLRRRGYTRPVDLGQAVLSLAHHKLQSTWVHGRFDAVCPLSNSKNHVALLQKRANSRVAAYWPAAGHLGGEPDIHRVLSALLASTSKGAA